MMKMPTWAFLSPTSPSAGCRAADLSQFVFGRLKGKCCPVVLEEAHGLSSPLPARCLDTFLLNKELVCAAPAARSPSD